MLIASRFSTSTMSMLKLSNALSIGIFLSSLQTAPGLMKPVERKVWLNGGISIFVLFFSFSRKLAIFLSFFFHESLSSSPVELVP